MSKFDESSRTVDGVTVIGPTREDFGSDEEFERYEKEWHLDRSLPQKEARFDGNAQGMTWLAGEVWLGFNPGTDDEVIAEVVESAGGTQVQSWDDSKGRRFVIFYVDNDFVDAEALAESLAERYPEDVCFASNHGTWKLSA